MNYASLSAEDFLNGQMILIDKPLHWTSFQAVNAVKWAIRKKHSFKKIKIGHAGTLDPLATGLLIICAGKMTKQIPRYQGQTKGYTGTIQLGAATPSYDLETEVVPTENFQIPKPETLEEARKQFVGAIQQRPPIFSALKKEGKRLYELARKGETTDIPFREITIYDFELQKPRPDHSVDFTVFCSKGTYIRSLAHDLGQALGTGGYLSALRRIQIGDFHVDKAIDPNEFKRQLGVD
jgi:tRNA pseudouridine55 synthase